MIASRRNILVLIKILITVMCFVLMFWYIGTDRIIEAFSNVNISIILLAFLLTPVCLVVKVYRWYLLARSVDTTVTFGHAILSYLAGLCLAVITPFATGELARGCYFSNRAEMTGKVFIDKLVDLTVVTVFTLLGIIFVPDYPLLKITACAPLAALLIIWVMRKWAAKILASIAQRTKIAALEKLGNAFATISTVLLLKIFFLAFVFFALFYFQAYVILRAFGGTPQLTTLLFFPLITLSTIIPVTIGGLGIREWAAVILLEQFDISKAVASSTFFTHFILINFIPALVGAFFVQRLIHKKDMHRDAV